ncbi:MAG: amino acid adenylation domain-containing protein [Gammaproteobacteria bacterium]|nr:amino acid adenylation domain-containing protein [Gammaproteobacteria bacterium]
MVHLVHEYFERSADRSPDKVAIGCGDDEITYKDLDEYTNGVAHYLIGEGVERGMLLPLYIEKNINAFKAVLGILKADCTYVPLDPGAPVARVDPILDRCEAKFVLVDDESEARMQNIIDELGISVRLINVEHIPIENTERREYKNISVDMVYVIFTSGSTGIPKGVMMSHFQVVDYIDFCVDLYEVTDKDVVSQHAPLYFDNSVLDIYCAFSAGARLELVYEELNVMIPKLASWLRDKEISMFLAVPSILTMLLKSRRLKPGMLPKMRNVIFSGEVIQPEIIADWMELYPDANYTNMYGPTEVTVDCTYHRILEPPKPEDGPVPIGLARPNMETFVRLDNGELSQEPGAEGELLIRGLAVGYGYLKEEEKTKKVFIQNPLHNVYHDPLYCSGDRVRLADNGEIMFLGRIDFQIKLRGNRIEPGEIEAALAGLDPVREAVVVYRHSPNPTEAAIGALLSKANSDDQDDDAFIRDVRERLTEFLPDYMIPTVMGVIHEDFPLTPAGKYDRRAVLARLFD